MRRIILALFGLIIVSTFSGTLAQVSNTGISGKVTSSNGSGLKGAKVVATHVPTGSLFAAITGDNGDFQLPGLSIGGPYSVRITMDGSEPFIRTNIYLIHRSDFRLDVTLRPKGFKERKRNSPHDTVLVVLSMDGFRWDYPDIYKTPNLKRMARKGVKAESMQPSYPSKTFPNHYSIATGLYPDHHGIVQNSFYDPRLNRTFRMGDRSAVQDSIFWEGEAIWETAASQGIRCAAYFWVGTESDEYFRPAYRKYYESGFPYNQQIDTVLSWLSQPPSSRPRLIMFYFDEPDGTSHDYGPVSDSTRAVVENLDRLVGRIVARLKKVEKREAIKVNLIILSDHGMGEIPEGNQVFLEDHIDLKRIVRINGGNPVITLEAEPGYEEQAYQLLKKAPHIKTFRKSELPAHYHYGTHPRIPGLIVEADSAFGLEIRRRAGVKYGGGTHGYDPLNRDMHGIFFATGPAFKSGWTQPTFENVSLYSLMAAILGIQPAKTDGDFNTVKEMLKGY